MYAKANNEDVNILLYKLGEGEIKNALGVAPVVMNATYDIKYLSEETEGYCFKAASGIAIDLTNRKQKPE